MGVSLRTRTGLLAGAAGIYLLQPAYERLHLLVSSEFHGWLPVGYLLFRPAPLPFGLSLSGLLALAFVALCLPLLLAPALARPVLTAGLALVTIELPVGLLIEAYRLTRDRRAVDYLSTAASLPACVIFLLVMWSLRARSGDAHPRTILRAWLLVAYAATMAKPGVVAM